MSRNARDPLALPERPSAEHLRKQAKRLKRERGCKLAESQQALAQDYGFSDWAALMAHVRALDPPPALSPLAEAARAGILNRLKALIAEGADAAEGGPTNPVWEACSSPAPPEIRLAMVEALLAAGADAREAVPGYRPLHVVADRGPVALAELLLRHGAIEWEPNEKGQSAADIARRSGAQDKAALARLLNRPVIDDPSFQAAVTAIHAGDVAGLERLLDAEPRLLTDRILEPDCYRASGRSQYFLDPKLVWFVANNPTLMERIPDNLVEVTRAVLKRGVGKADLDYTLGLAMTSTTLRERGLQRPLVALLLEAGATADTGMVAGSLAHGELEAVEDLVAAGMPLTAPVAAALGRLADLDRLLPGATPAERNEALDLAVINNRTEAVRMLIKAGATVDRMSAHHQHSQPLHQATLHDNVELARLLIEAGARTDVADDLWDATPVGWAWHFKNQAVFDYLKGLEEG